MLGHEVTPIPSGRVHSNEFRAVPGPSSVNVRGPSRRGVSLPIPGSGTTGLAVGPGPTPAPSEPEPGPPRCAERTQSCKDGAPALGNVRPGPRPGDVGVGPSRRRANPGVQGRCGCARDRSHGGPGPAGPSGPAPGPPSAPSEPERARTERLRSPPSARESGASEAVGLSRSTQISSRIGPAPFSDSGRGSSGGAPACNRADGSG
jgi:hypothetical protein